jgi:hypothetical protein
MTGFLSLSHRNVAFFPFWGRFAKHSTPYELGIYVIFIFSSQMMPYHHAVALGDANGAKALLAVRFRQELAGSWFTVAVA